MDVGMLGFTTNKLLSQGTKNNCSMYVTNHGLKYTTIVTQKILKIFI